MRWPDLDPHTRASILLQPCRKAVVHDYYYCGCEVVVGSQKVRLCQYHEGFDDGVEAARKDTQ